MKRKTKIVATLGPAVQQPAKLKALLRHADIIRINASHVESSQLPRLIASVRRAARAAGRPVSVLVDLQGPRIRTGRIPGGGPVFLKTGERVVLSSGARWTQGSRIAADHPALKRLVKKGSRIYLDNGLIELEALRVTGNDVRCRVLHGGFLGENKGINFPDAHLHLSALTAKDLRDLEAAARCNADLIALSFVQDETDVRSVKARLKRFGKPIPVIAKIEKREALRHIDAIMNVADGIMVARGDLGIEVGVEKVPFIQKALIRKANEEGLPVITATQMLESMMEDAQPSRAEVSDIANAVIDGTDAVMLSGETAVGKHPLAAIRMMHQILTETERYLEQISLVLNPARS